ncbi:hypothetical protein RN001_015136 [Aquatica leii]|uniref:Uncharacterized protein n=1 Tax=Aquatica leii TaxID=1421715 RepID=A0AAN7SBX3_9COLE|nr:hypothetical protein RN001_015136 [Aquatica leii]
MGNAKSEFVEDSVDPWWPSVPEPTLSESKKTFSEEILRIREKRAKLIGEKKLELNNLREELAKYKLENDELKKNLKQNSVFKVPGMDTIVELNKQLEKAHGEIAAFEIERQEYRAHVAALKDIIAVSKQLLLIKENQTKELSETVEKTQKMLADKESQIMSDDTRREYERQLHSIKQLKLLYEERQGALRKENSEVTKKLDEANVDLAALETKNADLKNQIEALEKDCSEKSNHIFSLESQLGLSKADSRELQSQLNVINQLFSQILISFNNGQEVDLDKLIKTLEENHDLLTDIVSNEECNQASSALPKILLDLVNQVSDSNSNQQEQNASGNEQQTLNSATEIVENLPKVWRILIELLSHQSAPISVLNENDPNSCYKSVQTPSGPTLVLSVSKTFIRLKNLIVEKKSLEKETTRLKQLNSHLETRLQDQEKRLEMVSKEVAKTWHVVGKMQKQHQMLHTQENILRYELAQKRKLLNELKEELEYCREKWVQAREKNSVTEKQWKQLQLEFASRKRAVDDFGNSVESGYSDDRESSNSDSDEDRVLYKRSTEKQNILKVVQEEIDNIENTSEASVSFSRSKHEDINDTYKKLEEHILETIKKTQNEDYPSVSAPKQETVIEGPASHSVEESVATTSMTDSVLSKREERLKKLEEETKQLVGIVTKNACRGVEFCSKLTELHDRYGASNSNTQESTNEEIDEEKTN